MDSVYSSALDSTATPPLPDAGFPVLCSPSNSDTKQNCEFWRGLWRRCIASMFGSYCRKLQRFAYSICRGRKMFLPFLHINVKTSVVLIGPVSSSRAKVYCVLTSLWERNRRCLFFLTIKGSSRRRHTSLIVLWRLRLGLSQLSDSLWTSRSSIKIISPPGTILHGHCCCCCCCCCFPGLAPP